MSKDRVKKYSLNKEAIRTLVENSGSGVDSQDVLAALNATAGEPDWVKGARSKLAIGAAIRAWSSIPQWRRLPNLQRQELIEEGFDLIYDEREKRTR